MLQPASLRPRYDTTAASDKSELRRCAAAHRGLTSAGGSGQTPTAEWNHLELGSEGARWASKESRMRWRRTRSIEAALDELHRDVYANNMAPYWVVDRSVAHDEDRQVMQGRKAVPFIWKYKRQIEPLLRRSAELIKTETSERRSLVLVNPGPGAAAGHGLDAVRRLPRQRSGRDHAAAPPFAERHSPRAHRLDELHRRRGREHRVRPRRSGADAARHLAQPRQPGRRAGHQS